jgi:6-phosphofructo-2-kinase/fructose-2,6-biphosphatase 2
MRYLRWLSIRAEAFNVGMYRRSNTPNPSAEFFDFSNTEGERLRRAAAEAAVVDMVAWFRRENGVIAILDATNSTKSRRRWIQERCARENIETLFVESLCNDPALIMSNIKEVKMTSPDYVGQDPEVAAKDFLERIKKYEDVYETIDEAEKDRTYVKLIDVGKHVVINGIKDYLQSRVIYYLMNLHIRPRSIWLSRVSSPPISSFISINTNELFLSTASPSTISLAKSVATPTSLLAVKPTLALCLI